MTLVAFTLSTECHFAPYLARREASSSAAFDTRDAYASVAEKAANALSSTTRTAASAGSNAARFTLPLVLLLDMAAETAATTSGDVVTMDSLNLAVGARNLANTFSARDGRILRLVIARKSFSACRNLSAFL